MSKNSTSGYGTIHTSSSVTPQSLSPPSTFISRAQTQTQNLISIQRPWREFFDLNSFSRPYNYAEAMSRVRRNLSYFRFNYTLVMLIIVFVSLVYHPISMIAFLIVFLGWLFFYFCRENPIVLFNYRVDERIVLVGLGLLTIGVLVGTHVGLNLLVALVIGVLVTGVHAAFRVTEDLFLDEEEAAEGGLLSVVDGGDRPLRPAFRG